MADDDRTNITSVIQLAKYQVGDSAYWVPFRPLVTCNIELKQEDAWIVDHHPKAYYDRGYAKPLWRTPYKLPRLHQSDFHTVVQLLTSRIGVEAFLVAEVWRSHNTGEFFYANGLGDQMPEAYLFKTKAAAVAERGRLLAMLRSWIDRQSEEA